MNVILGATADYLPYTAAAVASVCHHMRGGDRAAFHVMHAGDVGEGEAGAFRANLARFDDRAEFEFVRARDSLGLAERFRTTAHIKGAATYLRLYIPELFKGKFSRALYLDSDLIARRSLDELFSLDMGGKAIAGVEDTNSRASLGALWLPPDGRYVNAGVLLWDLDAVDPEKMREGLDAAAAGLVKYQITAGDQDLLALLFQGDIFYLHPLWNVLLLDQLDGRPLFMERAGRLNGIGAEEFRRALADPGVLHFVGGTKPWSSAWFHDELSRTWFEYARMTGYFDRRLAGMESENRLLSLPRRALGLAANIPQAWVLRRFYFRLPPHPSNLRPGRRRLLVGTRNAGKRLDALAVRNSAHNRDAGFLADVIGGGTFAGPFRVVSRKKYYGATGFASLAPSLFQSRDIRNFSATADGGAAGAIVCDAFDLDAAAGRSKAIEAAIAGGARLLFLEPGPVSAILDRCMSPRIPLRYRRYHSFRLDDLAFGFDTRVKSRLAEFLESPASGIAAATRCRCRRLIDRIVRDRLSTLNFLRPDSSPIRNGASRGVLVLGQTRGDPALRRSRAGTGDFARMLDDALRENEDREIYLYVDAADGGRVPFRRRRRENLHFISGRFNGYALLENVDTVYACNSRLGFEALLAGKKVVSYADSFYSGWGMTEDRNGVERRPRSRDIEELFHAVMFENAVHFSPFSPDRVEPEALLEDMARLRDEYFSWTGQWT